MKLTFAIVAILMAAAASLTPKEIAAGKKLYADKCGRCHKAFKIEKYPQPAWNMWMNQMMAKTKLTQKEADLLVRYLQSVRASLSENGNGSSQR
jgi:cytochrome c5